MNSPTMLKQGRTIPGLQAFIHEVYIPTFYGSSQVADFWAWVDAIEDCFEEMNPPEHIYCKLATYKLGGGAYNYWSMLQRERIVCGKEEITSWPRMKKKLFNRFLHSRCSTEFLKQSNKKENGEVKHLMSDDFTHNTMCSTKCPSQQNKHEEGDVVKHSTTDISIPFKCSTEASSESYNVKHDMFNDLSYVCVGGNGMIREDNVGMLGKSAPLETAVEGTELLDMVNGSKMFEAHEKEVICTQLSKIKDHQLSELVEVKLNANSVLIEDIQEESDSEAAKLEYKLTFMNNGELPNDVSVLLCLPRRLRELVYVPKDQNLKLSHGVGSNKRSAETMGLIIMDLILKLYLGDNKHTTPLIFGECVIASYPIDEIGLLSFDPGGSFIFQTDGNYLFLNYRILLKNEAANDRLLRNIARLKGEGEANEPAVVEKNELFFGMSGFKGSGLTCVGTTAMKMGSDLNLNVFKWYFVVAAYLFKKSSKKCSSEELGCTKQGPSRRYLLMIYGSLHVCGENTHVFFFTDITNDADEHELFCMTKPRYSTKEIITQGAFLVDFDFVSIAIAWAVYATLKGLAHGKFPDFGHRLRFKIQKLMLLSATGYGKLIWVNYIIMESILRFNLDALMDCLVKVDKIIQEGHEHKHKLILVSTAPKIFDRMNCAGVVTVKYSILSHVSKPGKRLAIEEQFARTEMLAPRDYIGPLFVHDSGGEYKEMKCITLELSLGGYHGGKNDEVHGTLGQMLMKAVIFLSFHGHWGYTFNLTRGRVIPWEGWKDEHNSNTKGKFILVGLNAVIIFSCLMILCKNGQLMKTLKLFREVVNGLDPPNGFNMDLRITMC